MESQWVHSHVPVRPSESLAIKLLLPMLNIKKLQGPHVAMQDLHSYEIVTHT